LRPQTNLFAAVHSHEQLSPLQSNTSGVSFICFSELFLTVHMRF
jgi:hypothetical protein